MGGTLPTNKVGVSLLRVAGHEVNNMPAQENRTAAEQRANDLITQVRGAKEVSNAAQQEIATLTQQASELGVSKGFTDPVVSALKKPSKAIVAAFLEDERTTGAFGKSATMSNLGHMLYQMYVKTQPNPYTNKERKPRAVKLSSEDKAWMRANIGNDWWGKPENDAETNAAIKAESIGELRAHQAGATEPMAEAEVDPSSMSLEQIVAALTAAKPSK